MQILMLKDKWVIVMRHSPERNEPHSIYAKHSSLHKKMIVAKDNGAKGIIFVSQVEDEELYPLRYVSGFKNDGSPAIILSKSRANKIFERVGWSIKRFRKEMNQNLKPLNFQLGLLRFDANINIEPVIKRGLM